jgi:hypothetical protein
MLNMGFALKLQAVGCSQPICHTSWSHNIDYTSRFFIGFLFCICCLIPGRLNDRVCSLSAHTDLDIDIDFSFVSSYGTIYTMFPVFSLVWDKDVSPLIALTYPELYKELSKGRSLSYKTFLIWTLISIYQGGCIMYGSLLLFEHDFNHIVAITYTALILTELLMVGLTIRTWHPLNVLSMLLSLALYLLSLIILRDQFGKTCV